MDQLDLISRPHADKGHRLRALLASCVFHGLMLGLIVGLTFLYRSQMPPPKSGSAPGAPSISLEKIVVIPPPPAAQPPKPTIALPAPAPTVAAITPPHQPEAKPVPPEATVPILAVQPSKLAQAAPSVQTQTAIHPAITHPPVATAQSSPPKAAAAASPSSYAPGPSVLPHPPYPTEARDRGQTGTVIMNVQFDARGGVTLAEVAQSSGVPILDSETRSFIRAHWHSPAYAGQTVSVPVQYKLENL